MKKITYKHPQFDRIKTEVSRQIDSNFNQLPLEVVNKWYDNDLYDYIAPLDIDIILDDYMTDYNAKESYMSEFMAEQDSDYAFNNNDFREWIKENYEDEIYEYGNNKENYPVWNTLFEAKDNYMSEWIEEHVKELQDKGFGVIRSGDTLNAMLFFTGCGYDFYLDHWIPLFVELLEWITIEEKSKNEYFINRMEEFFNENKDNVYHIKVQFSGEKSKTNHIDLTDEEMMKIINAFK